LLDTGRRKEFVMKVLRSPTAVICLAACILAGPSPAPAAPRPIQQITDNDVDDQFPQISGTDVVWQRRDGLDWDIILYQGGIELPPLTDNDWDDQYPTISGTNIVWESSAESHTDVVLYNGTTATQWTSDSRHDKRPHISGSNVVWAGWEGDDWEIYSDNISDGPGETQITHNDIQDDDPRISGNHIVWESRVGQDLDDWEIFFYDGADITRLTTDSPPVKDLNPDVNAQTVVWQRYEGNPEIVIWDGQTIAPITNDGLFDVNAAIAEELLVWRHTDGSVVDDYEIVARAGGNIYQLTNNEFEEGAPGVSGDIIVWEGWDGNDWEIYMTTLPEPATLFAMIPAWAVLLNRRRRRRNG